MIPIEDFIIPDFLQNETVESIHARMLNSLPSDVDIDKSEGQFLWDFTRPTALEKQYFVEYKLVEAIKLIFPMFSSGIYLDYHAESRNMKRKSATASVGTITITGAAGVEIPLGARIIAIADAYDSLVSFRPYREGLTPEEALKIIEEKRGEQFDPNILDIFENVVDEANKEWDKLNPYV